MKYKWALFICSGFGSGFFPKAPGTVASLLVALIVWLTMPHFGIVLAAFIIITIAGVVWAPTVEKTHGKDAGLIVVDEWSGQLLALMFFFPVEHYSLFVLLSFLLFRLLDIAKPLGINRLQKLRGGWGVVLDDILAGLYVCLILNLALWIL